MSWQNALYAFAGMGFAALALWTWRMAAYATVFVSDRLKAWRAYDKERDAHQQTLRRLYDIESLCLPLGWNPDAEPVAHWLDQRFAAQRAEVRRQNKAAAEMLRPAMASSTQAAFREHVAAVDGLADASPKGDAS